MKKAKITNDSHATTEIIVSYCDTFFLKLMGLMFSRDLPINSGLLLVEKFESILNTSIHMLFMNFDISAIWLDQNLVVCDKCLAKKWHLAYFPAHKAQFVLELHSSQLPNYSLGDQLRIEYEK
jgi:uncharacterized membrane protein (UPF0127 family)